MIGDQIEVTVLSVAGEKVRLGIRAPREVPVLRDELYAEVSGLDRPAPATQPAVPNP